MQVGFFSCLSCISSMRREYSKLHWKCHFPLWTLTFHSLESQQVARSFNLHALAFFQEIGSGKLGHKQSAKRVFICASSKMEDPTQHYYRHMQCSSGHIPRTLSDALPDAQPCRPRALPGAGKVCGTAGSSQEAASCHYVWVQGVA